MAEKENFTEKRVLEFQVPGLTQDGKPRQAIYWDAKTPGLGLRVTSGGARAYVFQTQLLDRKSPDCKPVTIRITIGDQRTWSVGAAQEEACQLKAKTDKGIDPREERAKQIRQDATEREGRRRKSVHLSEAWEAYCEARKNKWGERTLYDHKKVIDPGGKPKTRGRKRGESDKTVAGSLAALRNVPLTELTREKIKTWLDGEVAIRPTQAALGFRLLRGFLNWAKQDGGYAVQADTCAGLARNSLAKSKPKADCLQREQISLWFSSVRKIPNPVISAYLQAALLTGARREELAWVRWEDIDFQWRTLTIRDKVEGERTIPLTPYVASLLAPLPRRKMLVDEVEVPNPWAFSSPMAVSGRLQEPRIQHNKALQASGLPPLSIHGLRRSFGSLSEWVEVPVGIVAQIMGHKPSAIAEKHYRVRPLDLLRAWHTKIEAWILEQAGIELPTDETGIQGLRVVGGKSK